MDEYHVEVTETRSNIITVVANSKDEAKVLAKEGYDNNEYKVTTLDSVIFDVLN